MGRVLMIILNSTLIYYLVNSPFSPFLPVYGGTDGVVNHSCAPSVYVVLPSNRISEWHVKAGPKGIKEKEDLTFFYPSTEWDMAQGFDCNCGASVSVMSSQKRTSGQHQFRAGGRGPKRTVMGLKDFWRGAHGFWCEADDKNGERWKWPRKTRGLPLPRFGLYDPNNPPGHMLIPQNCLKSIRGAKYLTLAQLEERGHVNEHIREMKKAQESEKGQ